MLNIEQDLLHELFDYKDGQLIRKVKTANCTNIGDVVGKKEKNGYIRVKIYNVNKIGLAGKYVIK